MSKSSSSIVYSATKCFVIGLINEAVVPVIAYKIKRRFIEDNNPANKNHASFLSNPSAPTLKEVS